jgi:hypothetical protein
MDPGALFDRFGPHDPEGLSAVVGLRSVRGFGGPSGRYPLGGQIREHHSVHGGEPGRSSNVRRFQWWLGDTRAVTNQRLYLAVALAAIFLVIFALTTGILVTLELPREQAAPTGDDVSGKTRPAARPEWLYQGGGFVPTPHDRFADPQEERLRAAAERSAGPVGRYGGGADPASPMEWQAAGPIGPGSTTNPRSPFEGYRFRPLEERERRRMERQSEDTDDRRFGGYRWPDDASRDHPLYPETPFWDSSTSGSDTEPYRFRPVEPPRSTTDPWRSKPGPPARGGYVDPRIFEPIPQWGATPPELPPPIPYMYPSLTTEEDHRLSLQ